MIRQRASEKLDNSDNEVISYESDSSEDLKRKL